nr:usherin-like isoform X2 [Crassostrea virginica]
MKKMWTEFCVLSLLVPCASGFVNLAHTPAQTLQGTASMSQPPQNPAWSADKAVDGDTDQEVLTTCAVMDYSKNYKAVWWKVRLGRRFNVAYLEVYFRSSTITRASGFYFYSFDSTEVFDPNSPNPNNLVYHNDPMSGCPASLQNITVNRLAQEIVFINKRPPDYRSNCAHDNWDITTVDICEVKVMGCDTHRYSYDCTTICDNKCKLQQCDAFNGSCIYGCTEANALTIDCVVCQDGLYISNKVCKPCQGHCKDGAPCNKSTGRCDNGCSNHWTGTFCETCPSGYYGGDCNNVCGKCAGDDVCDNQSGDCPGECLGNLQKPKCNVCKPGFYNSTTNCLSRCGHCKDNVTCEKESGYCSNGCGPYFKDPYCQECQDGFYGITCNVTCGNCKDGQPCDRDTGECMNGCDSYVKPPLCKEIISSKLPEKRCTDDSTSFSWSYVVIGILGILLAIAVAFIVYLKRQRPVVQHDKQKTSTQNYDNLTVLKENHQYATMNSETNDSHYQELQETAS